MSLIQTKLPETKRLFGIFKLNREFKMIPNFANKFIKKGLYLRFFNFLIFN